MDIKIACPCPPRADGDTRHPDGDTVTLRDRLDFRSATTIRKAVSMLGEDGPVESAEVLAVMTEWYLLLGIEAWTLVDDRGKPVPVTRPAIRERLLENDDAYASVTDLADAADGMYMKLVLLPLLERASRSSPPTPTDASTSAPTALPPKRPKPSRPSSTTSTRTDGTAMTSTSPGGASSTSQNAASAA